MKKKKLIPFLAALVLFSSSASFAAPPAPTKVQDFKQIREGQEQIRDWRDSQCCDAIDVYESTRTSDAWNQVVSSCDLSSTASSSSTTYMVLRASCITEQAFEQAHDAMSH